MVDAWSIEPLSHFTLCPLPDAPCFNATAQILNSEKMSTTHKKLGVALIGCGAISYVNAEAVQKSQNARLTYAVDVNLASAKTLGEKYSIPFTARLEEALSAREVDAVFICTPHYLHAPIVEQAAAAGKHVIVEKPMGVNLEDSRRIVNVCRQARVKLSVCYCMRYWDNINIAKEFIDQGGLGKVLGTEIMMSRDRTESYLQRNTWQEVNPNWHGVKAKSGGGLFIDNFSHYLDYFGHLTGLKIKWVMAKADTFLIPADVEDTLMAVGAYSNGASCSIIAGSAIRGAGTEKNPRTINSLQRIWGEYGQILLEPELSLFSVKRIGEYEPGRWFRQKSRRWRASTGAGIGEREDFIDAFARAVREGREPEITGEDGLRVMEVIDAVYRSARTGEKIVL